MKYTGVFGRGKVDVLETKRGIFCKSYDTIVVGIVNGKLQRYWNGYSKTTMNHIGAFVTDYNVSMVAAGKPEAKIEWAGVKTWDLMPVNVCPVTLKVV